MTDKEHLIHVINTAIYRETNRTSRGVLITTQRRVVSANEVEYLADHILANGYRKVEKTEI